ncbi:MAG TPA: hypothetical protein VF519_15870 [Mycobacteriales bacterium]|jgi:hypothetical protein
MRRTLALKKESLSALSTDELAHVAGGQSGDCIDPPSNVCIQTYQVGCLISRMMYPCLTEPTLVCD